MKSIFSKIKRKALLGGAIGAGVITGTTQALAADPTVKDITGRILGVMTSIFRYIGIILLAWSIGMLILALKNEDADSKSRAIMLMVVSVALIAFKSVLDLILKSFGITITELSGW